MWQTPLPNQRDGAHPMGARKDGRKATNISKVERCLPKTNEFTQQLVFNY